MLRLEPPRFEQTETFDQHCGTHVGWTVFRQQKASPREFPPLSHESSGENRQRSVTQDCYLLDLDGIADDVCYAANRELVNELPVQQAGEVGVQTLVPADELVAEAQTGHETSLLQPEHSAEATRKEDTLSIATLE